MRHVLQGPSVLFRLRGLGKWWLSGKLSASFRVVIKWYPLMRKLSKFFTIKSFFLSSPNNVVHLLYSLLHILWHCGDF